jgi:hypothetical protein
MNLRAHRARLRFATLLLICPFALGMGSASRADDTVARIEEDWQLVVNSPDIDNNGPQVTCVITPGILANGYCALDLNYATQPDYSPGGVQMHVWNPSTPIVTKNMAVQGQLQQQNETVTWTQSMTLTEDQLTFQVINGQSNTWGQFGGGDDATLTVHTGNASLSGYSPDQSVKNSGVCYASNLVTSLTLTTVRYYNAAGQLIQTDATSRSVTQQN